MLAIGRQIDTKELTMIESFLAGAVFGIAVLRVIASLTYGAQEGTLAGRINAAIVGPWRPKK